MAAFCACCGAEIILKVEACFVCGTPQHGMPQPDLLLTLDVGTDPFQEDIRIGRELHRVMNNVQRHTSAYPGHNSASLLGNTTV